MELNLQIDFITVLRSLRECWVQALKVAHQSFCRQVACLLRTSRAVPYRITSPAFLSLLWSFWTYCKVTGLLSLMFERQYF